MSIFKHAYSSDAGLGFERAYAQDDSGVNADDL